MAKAKITREQMFMNKVGDVLIAVEELDKFAESFPAGKKALAAALDHIAKKRQQRETTKP